MSRYEKVRPTPRRARVFRSKSPSVSSIKSDACQFPLFRRVYPHVRDDDARRGTDRSRAHRARARPRATPQSRAQSSGARETTRRARGMTSITPVLQATQNPDAVARQGAEETLANAQTSDYGGF